MAQGMKRNKALEIGGISKDQYYHQPKAGHGGAPKSKMSSFMTPQGWEDRRNEEVVIEIKKVKLEPDESYGYRKMTYHLMLQGYKINHKKVYRLMREANLLEEKRRSKARTYVKYRKVTPDGPLQVLEMDIKQVWIEKGGRYSFILTILDTFTRVALHYQQGYRMRQGQVQAAWKKVIEEHLQPADCLREGLHIEVRNDNGPQFGAKAVQEFFKKNHLFQVFTHPYTPQENGQIKSFHAILSKHLNRSTFWTLEQLEQDLTIFYEKYNNSRLHASTAYLPPRSFWETWNAGLIHRRINSKKQVTFKLKIPYHRLSTELDSQPKKLSP